MDFLPYIFIFCSLWWVILFIALPIGIKVDKTSTKFADSAPIKPNIPIKFLITTIVALILTGCIAYLLESGYISYTFSK